MLSTNKQSKVNGTIQNKMNVVSNKMLHIANEWWLIKGIDVIIGT
jgi:hypothetical protein